MCISRTWKGLISIFLLGRPFNQLVVFNCIFKNNWFYSFQKEKFLSLHSISNHTLTIIQRLSQCLPSPESPGFLKGCSLPGSPKEVIIHDASLPPESTGFLNCCSLLGSPRRCSVSFSTCWGRFLPGDLPRSLTLPCGPSW